MRRLAVWLTVCALGVALVALVPAGSAAASVRGTDAQRAIDAALAHAGVSGMTFEFQGALHQRSAAGDVAVVVAKGRVEQMLLREGGGLRLLTPYATHSTYPRIVQAVNAAYAAASPAYGAAVVDPVSEAAFAPWFDPFAQVAEDPDAEVVVDETGRAVEVRVAGATTVRVLRWDAPLAVRPARDSVVTAETPATMAAVEASADFSYALTKQLAAIANREATYSSEPVATLRRVAHDTGWIARASQGGGDHHDHRLPRSQVAGDAGRRPERCARAGLRPPLAPQGHAAGEGPGPAVVECHGDEPGRSAVMPGRLPDDR